MNNFPFQNPVPISQGGMFQASNTFNEPLSTWADKLPSFNNSGNFGNVSFAPPPAPRKFNNSGNNNFDGLPNPYMNAPGMPGWVNPDQSLNPDVYGTSLGDTQQLPQFQPQGSSIFSFQNNPDFAGLFGQPRNNPFRQQGNNMPTRQPPQPIVPQQPQYQDGFLGSPKVDPMQQQIMQQKAMQQAQMMKQQLLMQLLSNAGNFNFGNPNGMMF